MLVAPLIGAHDEDRDWRRGNWLAKEPQRLPSQPTFPHRAGRRPQPEVPLALRRTLRRVRPRPHDEPRTLARLCAAAARAHADELIDRTLTEDVVPPAADQCGHRDTLEGLCFTQRSPHRRLLRRVARDDVVERRIEAVPREGRERIDR